MLKFVFFAAVIACALVQTTCNTSTQPAQPTTAKAQKLAMADAQLMRLENAIAQHPDSLPLYDRLLDTLARRGDYNLAAS
ncbi:MAG: hypothetical protein EAY75_17925, partial [Bacteroidetes bacterium]